MTNIYLDRVSHCYKHETKTFTMSEKDAGMFSITLIVHGAKEAKAFQFDHMTGPEFDPTTSCIFKSSDGYILEIKNDYKITKANADAYLQAKLRH